MGFAASANFVRRARASSNCSKADLTMTSSIQEMRKASPAFRQTLLRSAKKRVVAAILFLSIFEVLMLFRIFVLGSAMPLGRSHPVEPDRVRNWPAADCQPRPVFWRRYFPSRLVSQRDVGISVPRAKIRPQIAGFQTSGWSRSADDTGGDSTTGRNSQMAAGSSFWPMSQATASVRPS
jgi:hypothetical protein